LPDILYIYTQQIILPKPKGIMKKRENSLDVSELKAVAHFEDYLVLFIAREDQNVPTSLCVQANFDTLQFDPVQPMSVYLTALAYQKIHDADRRISYRQRIQKEMNPDVITAMLMDFSQKRLANQENDINLNWEPSWEHPY
jgi:rRNA maturation protein Rpf1